MANTTPTGAGSNGGTTTVVTDPPNPPTTNTVPNTTTDTKIVEYQKAARESVFDPRQDIGENVFDPGVTYNGPATQESVFDPRQEPAESVFNPGPTYNGPATQESVFDPRQDVGENVFDPNAALPNPAVTAAAQLNDPYAGLSPTQLQKLGGADPTDPYIRARLGIPQLPGPELAATPGFGTIKTGIPLVDNALSALGSLFSFSGKTTKPSVTTTGTTTGSPVPTPDTAAVAQDATKLLVGDTALTDDEDQNLQNIVGAQVEIARAEENIQSNNRQILANEEAQAAAQEQQRQAQAIIDQNNAELADDTLPDDRRAELEANNAAQRASIAENAAVIDETQNNIDNASANNERQTDSIITNQGVLGENSKAFAINNNNGANPTQVSALEDPGIQENVFDPGVGPPQSESVFDPTQDVGENVFDPGITYNGPATGTDSATLSAEQADAFYNGTGTPTAAQQAATNEQTAADAAALYPGTNNTNLKNINEASAAVAQNEAGIANAQSIIDRNNAELADPDISDERRAELEANNASQENYIRLAEDNTAENELVIESNADAFAAGGGNPDSGQGPDEVSALEDPAAEAAENVFDPGETINANGESVFDPEGVDPNSDPFEQARFEAELAADVPPNEIVLTPDEQAAADDPLEQRRLELEQEANREQLTEEAVDVEPDLFAGQSDEFGGVDEAIAIQQADIDTRNDPALSDEEIQAELDRAVESDTARDVNTDNDPGENVFNPGETINAGDESVFNPAAVDATQDLANERNDAAAVDAAAAQESNVAANSQAATKLKAKNQATLQSRYKQTGDTDWRVRLMLAESSDYLYNASDSNILTPLKATNGVIFPYTPNISINYQANYEQYDLTHSNYRGVFYKNSRVGDISLRGTFTAQDTTEASYMLAVIHFFRSVTKMFYGKDEQRGTPPPLVYLAGYGDFQFKEHPCLVSSFNYTLPNDVDYIRAANPNNYGINMLGRRSAPLSSVYPGIAGLLRLASVGLPKGAVTKPPAPGGVTQNVANTERATYVPTKMEIDITLIPVQTRDQVSKQFSLKGFANGNLLKGGFW